MSVLQLSLNEARHLHLAAQGLLKKPRRRARPEDILSTIQQMSLLQIRYHQRGGPQPLSGAVQPPRQLSAALAG